MRVTTLIYGLASLALAGVLFHRHDCELARYVLLGGLAATGLFTVLDVVSTWGVVAPPKPTLREQILDAVRQREVR